MIQRRSPHHLLFWAASLALLLLWSGSDSPRRGQARLPQEYTDASQSGTSHPPPPAPSKDPRLPTRTGACLGPVRSAPPTPVSTVTTIVAQSLDLFAIHACGRLTAGDLLLPPIPPLSSPGASRAPPL
ncbi:MAG: hypothetical protein HYZ53_13450 [Planctomycetes bacterium]|nr:hypothetical protein [Planctomycetota bacterium]